MNWQLFAIGSALFAGLTAVLAKIGVRDIPSNLATFIRTLVILPILMTIVFLNREWRPLSSIPHKTLVFLVLSGMATGASWLCYYRALQLGPVSLVASIDKTSLLVAVILSVVLFGERLSLFQWMGAGLMMIGALFVMKKT